MRIKFTAKEAGAMPMLANCMNGFGEENWPGAASTFLHLRSQADFFLNHSLAS